MVDVSEPAAARGDDRVEQLSRDDRGWFIQRIAILYEHNLRMENELKQRGIAVPRMPKADDVRPAILAEGVVAELKRLQAELRLCEQDLEEAQRERDDAQAGLAAQRVSAAGVGESGQVQAARRRAAVEPPHDDGPEFMPTDEDPMLAEPPIAEVAAATTEPEPSCETAGTSPASSNETAAPVASTPPPKPRGRPRRVAAAILERKTAEPEQLVDVVHRYLVQRDSSASAPFITGAIAAAGRQITADQVFEACRELVADGRAREGSIGGVTVWKAL